MLTSAQNLAVVRTELDSVFYQEFNYQSATPSQMTALTAEIFKPLTIDRRAYIEEVFKGSELFKDTGETEVVGSTTPKAANKLTTYVKDFTQSIELSKDLFDDNMHGFWSRSVSDMATKAVLTQTDNAMKVFRLAFTTTLNADGTAWLASHTLISGGTQSTLLTGALSPTTLNNGIIALAEMKDQAGVIMGNQPAYLIVPPALFKKAIEITDSALIADVANNNINVYRSAYGITVYTSPYLGAAAGGSDTAWFLLARNHCVTRLVRQGIQTSLRDWTMSNNRTYLYQANFREEVYVPDYVGAVGSTGV
jgi:hypothetical protein